MKNFKQLLEALPSKTVVFAFGRFNPPTTEHELLIKVVKKLAVQNKSEYAIYASKIQDTKKNPLSVDKKVHYLKLMFPGTNFIEANQNERTFIESVKKLNKKFKNLIMVAGSDRVSEYEKILNKYNGTEFHYDSVQVISAGERDPDADDAPGISASKMRALAAKGNYTKFKKGLPTSLRDIDGKRLMNDIRVGMGLDTIKEQIVFSVDSIREQYYRGEIYHIGDIVESFGQRFEIVDRGTNYLVVVDSEGTTHRKWLKDVTMSENQIKEDIQPGPVPSEITFKGYTTQNLHHSEDARRAFMDTIRRAGKSDPVAVLNALKATDAYMKINDHHLENNVEIPDPKDMNEWRAAHAKAKDSLDRIGEFAHHEDYWHMHGHEIEDMLSNYKEEGKGEMSDSTNIEGNMIQEELTDKTLKANDKIKVARIIASMLGIENPEKSTSPVQLVNNALRKVRSKVLNADGLKILNQMLQLANEVKIDYDKNLVPSKLKENVVNTSTKHNFAKGRMRFSDYKKIIKNLKLEPDDTENDIDAEMQNNILSSTPKMGHTMQGTQDDQLRIRKIKYRLGEETDQDPETQREQNLEDQMTQELDLSDEQLDAIIDMTPEDDYMEAYEPEEFGVIDVDTGEEVPYEEPAIREHALMEVLSRAERIRAKARFARTAAKRERRMQIALKTHSSNKTINARARKMAISLMKKRLLRGRNINSLSIGEKERIERVIEKRKSVIGRLAMKLVSRIRNIEKSRLSHSKYTTGSANSTF